MKQIIFTLILIAASLNYAISQVPQMFSYQAAIRNTNGTVLANEDVEVKVILRKVALDGDIVYEELHSKTTSGQGVISMAVGGGDPTYGIFSEVPWSESIFIQIDIKKTGETSFNTIGVSQILSVPYALYAGNAIQGDGTLGQTVVFDGNFWASTSRVNINDNTVEVKTQEGRDVEEPIFAVRNSNNEIVFAVYESGARVYIAEEEKQKSTRGGFAVGGLSDQNKQEGTNYLSIMPDEVQFNILQPTDVKSTRGGFAVGGLSDQNKQPTHNYFTLKSDSVRFLLVDNTLKNTRGGFAVGGLSDQNKGFNDYFMVNSDSTYVMNTLSALGNVIIQGDMLTGGTVGTLPVTDIDGNIYQTVKIGTQVWMKENLRTSKYTNGLQVEPFNITVNPDGNIITFGNLYSFTAIMNPIGLCPVGWHVPSQLDWEQLFFTIGGDYWGENVYTLAARLLDNSELWTEGDIIPNNMSGFSARPGGYAEFYSDWIYGNFGYAGYYWSSGSVDGTVGYQIDNQSGLTPLWDEFQSPAFSIRCVKDSPIID